MNFQLKLVDWRSLATVLGFFFVIAGAAAQSNPPPCNPEEEVVAPPLGCEFSVTLTRVQFTAGTGPFQGPEDLPNNLMDPDRAVLWPKMLEDTTTVITGGFVNEPALALGEYRGGEIKLFESRSPYQVLALQVVTPNATRQFKVCFSTTGTYEDENDVQSAMAGNHCVILVLDCPTLATVSQTAVVKLGNGFHLEFDVEAKMTDIDGDGIGTEDWIDDPCYEPGTHHGSAGEAVLVWFYFSGNGISNLAQTVGTNINKMLDETSGYDYTHVWIDPDSENYWISDNDHNPFTTLEPMQVADSWSIPTEENFFGEIRRLTAEGYNLTIIIMSHGYEETWEHSGHCDAPGCVIDDDDWDDLISGYDIYRLMHPVNIGIDIVPIRMVYSNSCVFETLHDDFLSVGAQSISGAFSINFFPNYWGAFSDNWLLGGEHRDAVADSESGLSGIGARTAAATYINSEGELWKITDGSQLSLGCPVGPGTFLTGSVLRRNDCAADAFQFSSGHAIEDTFIYNLEANGFTYNSNFSGLSNMVASSTRFIDGDTRMTRFKFIDWDFSATFIDPNVSGPP